MGIKLDQVNGWSMTDGGTWIFGPCPIDDNLHQCLPQVTLHGMDEGLTMKLAQGILELAIAIGRRAGRNATMVSANP